MTSTAPLLGDTTYDEEDECRVLRKRSLCSRFLRRPFCVMVVTFLVTSIVLVCIFLGIYYTGVLSEKSGLTGCIGVEKSYRYASVASDAQICSKVGTDILAKLQGSAADAAIATLLCLGLANAHSMGIGGGFFATIYERKTKTAYALDSRDVAPLRSYKDMFANRTQDITEGGLAITVPSEIAGYRAMHKKFGVLPWKTLFEPTIKLCLDGFPLAEGLHRAMVDKEEEIMKNEGLRKLFVNASTGKLYNVGDKLKNPKLAATLTRIASDNETSPRYPTSCARDMALDIQDAGGNVTEEDFKNYTVRWRNHVNFELKKGLRLFSLPPPSSGILIGFILKILDGYNFSPRSIEESDTVLTHHRIVEAWKFAFAKRFWLGDEDFVNITQLVGELLSPAYAQAVRKNITDDRTHDPTYYGNVGGKLDGGTSHLSILAANGDAVAVTSSINAYFGSKVVGNRTGIIFNNGMDDFSVPNVTNIYDLPPSPNNFIEPQKRPMSSMTPIIIVDDKGDVQLVAGASGGSKIITGTSYVTSNVHFFNTTLKDAIDTCRLHHQWIPDYIVYEKGVPKSLLDGLAKKGHKLQQLDADSRGSIVQAILHASDGLIHSYSDTRKGGCPDGY